MAMPLPPPKSRKHRTIQEAQAARQQALAPYQFKPGESGNPLGFSGSRRAQYEEIARIAAAGAPEHLENLRNLAFTSADERVRVLASKTWLEFVPQRAIEAIAEEAARASPTAGMSQEEKREWLYRMVRWASGVPEMTESGEIIEVLAPPGQCRYCDARRVPPPLLGR